MLTRPEFGLGNILTTEQHLRNALELIKKTAEAL